jgi:hypothetical protein
MADVPAVLVGITLRGVPYLLNAVLHPLTRPTTRIWKRSNRSGTLAIGPVEKVGGLVTLAHVPGLLLQQVHGLKIFRWVVDLLL